jgi:hypothetical protein
MATKEKTAKKATPGPVAPRKRSPRAMAKAIKDTETKVHAAVHAVLRKSGLNGVKVHSVNFSVAPSAMTAQGCQDCDLTTHNCVLTPDGWVCLPNS